MAQPIYRCWTKATTRELGVPRRSLNWMLSRRGWFKILKDRVECGNWVIPFDQVVGGTVYRTKQMLIPATVLELRTSTDCYQFGFNPWATPVEQLPIKLPEQSVQLRYSLFSILLRLLIVGLAIYLILKR